MRIRILFMLLAMSASLMLTPSYAAAPEAEPLAAMYETSYTDRDGKIVERGHWYLLRQAARIETLSEDRAEIWQRSPRGSVSLRRVFRDHQIVLEYAPAELAARGVRIDWQALGSVIEPEALKRLTTVKPAEGEPASDHIVLTGTSNGEQVEVWWLPQQRIPALIKRSGPRGAFTMRLVETRKGAPGDWLPSARWPIGDFRTIDAADIGDLEHDAAVKRLLRGDRAAKILEPHAHSHD